MAEQWTTEDEWTVDGFMAEIQALEDSPPPTPDWQERIECDTHRWPTYVAHVEGMYPAACPSCIYESQRQQIVELQHRSHRPWLWKWKPYAWLARHGYSWGLTAGSSWGNMCSLCGTTTRISWRGRRRYIFGVERETWGCLLKRHHRRTEAVDCGLCSKCCPCPTCGSTDPTHNVCEVTK